jgi:hypothetical protein
MGDKGDAADLLVQILERLGLADLPVLHRHVHLDVLVVLAIEEVGGGEIVVVRKHEVQLEF